MGDANSRTPAKNESVHLLPRALCSCCPCYPRLRWTRLALLPPANILAWSPRCSRRPQEIMPYPASGAPVLPRPPPPASAGPIPPSPPPRPPLRSATMGTSPEPSKPTLCYLDTTTPPPAAPPLAGRTSPGGRPRIQHAYTCLDEINKVLFQKGAYPVKTTIVVVCGNYENSKHDYMMLIRWLEKRGDVIL